MISHEEVEGAVNLSAPDPRPNADFMRNLRVAWGTRLGMPAPAWLLVVGTFFIRSETELILKSRRVTPARLLQNGFTFQFPTWPEAAQDLCAQWRAMGADAASPKGKTP